MREWREIVRRHLLPLGLPAEREAEVVEELAQLLEDYAAEAGLKFSSEREAVKWARGQVPEWGGLALEIRRNRRAIAGLAGASGNVPLGGRPSLNDGKRRNVMGGIWQDVKYGVRMLAKYPGFSVVAIVTLALGIGLNTAVFSFVNAMLFKPLPFERPEELAAVYTTMPKEFVSHQPMSFPDYLDIRERSRTLKDVAGYTLIHAVIEADGQTKMILGEAVTGNYFSTTGIRPHIGRLLGPEDNVTKGAHPVIVVSYGTWQRRFGGDPGVLGRTTRLNGQTLTVVGVVGKEFTGSVRGFGTEFWLPTSMVPAMGISPTVNMDNGNSGGKDRLDDRNRRWMWVIGRLKNGAKVTQANAEVQAIAKQLEETYPESNRNRTAEVVAAKNVRLLPGVDKVLYGVGLVLMTVVGLVLLIASANVANMLLSRATARKREIAVRVSLGAGRGRVVRQLLTESVLLSLAGAAGGMLLAAWSNSLLNGVRPPLPGASPLALGLELDWRVFLFAAVCAMGTAVLFGLAPALQVTRTDLAQTLREEAGTTTAGRSKGRLRGALVVAQVALSLVLLIAAGLEVRSLQNASQADPGIAVRGIVTAQFYDQMIGYRGEKRAEFYRRLEEKVKALPGVESVAFTTHLPLTFNVNTDKIAAAGKEPGNPEEWPNIDTMAVTPGYFETFRVPVLSGRSFTEQDSEKAPLVAVVNETLAKRFWPGEEAVGQFIRRDGDEKPYQVIGVVRDGKYRTLGEDPVRFFYVSLRQSPYGGRLLVARTQGAEAQTLAAIRDVSRAVDEKVPVGDLQTAEEALAPSLIVPKAGAGLFGLFGLLGMVLAAVGIYGVVAYAVGQRTHEIGIRMALGAGERDILRLVVQQGLRLTLVGIGVGLAGAAAVTHALSATLIGVSAVDAVTFASVAAILLAVAGLASWIPARRATRVDPMTALRYE